MVNAMNDLTLKEFSMGAGSYLFLLLIMWLGTTDVGTLTTVFVSIGLGLIFSITVFHIITVINMLYYIARTVEHHAYVIYPKSHMELPEVCVDMYSTRYDK